MDIGSGCSTVEKRCSLTRLKRKIKLNARTIEMERVLSRKYRSLVRQFPRMDKFS